MVETGYIMKISCIGEMVTGFLPMLSTNVSEFVDLCGCSKSAGLLSEDGFGNPKFIGKRAKTFHPIVMVKTGYIMKIQCFGEMVTCFLPVLNANVSEAVA